VEEMLRRTRSRAKRAGRALGATVNLDGTPVLIASCSTYMNESGLAAQWFVKRMGVAPHRLLVVCDDINLPLGRLRLRRSGGDGGHKGLRSITEALDSSEFPRLRVGVGVLPAGEDAVGFVLVPFEESEQAQLQQTLKRAADCLETVIRDGLEAAMDRFNRDAAANQP
jgi:PTH1 family peptidyl-tRNA hydrolase